MEMLLAMQGLLYRHKGKEELTHFFGLGKSLNLGRGIRTLGEEAYEGCAVV